MAELGRIEDIADDDRMSWTGQPFMAFRLPSDGTELDLPGTSGNPGNVTIAGPCYLSDIHLDSWSERDRSL